MSAAFATTRSPNKQFECFSDNQPTQLVVYFDSFSLVFQGVMAKAMDFLLTHAK